MYYLLVTKVLSTGSLDKVLTSYDSRDTALRKFHEAFNVIGGGPTRISALLMFEPLDESLPSSISIIKNETWMLIPTTDNSQTE